MSMIPYLFGGRRTNVFDPFSLDVSDPFDSFRSISDSLPSGLSGETAALANTRIDWKETPEAHVFKADLPGLKKEEVKVEVEEGRGGEEQREVLEEVQAAGGAKVDQVKAAMENGVLTVTVPKEEVKKPEVKAIDISG
ncbi:17.3 kDa class I heat shock protein [Acorus calamus]|uniref:17.3 kDa class I heat shock protein n=1 Tax=Acorus calamus TaxID=4465 RepID=A0AAV9D6D7_ACOCL|nr:17.3 kDa class I heat shock protein [Acorus calamus]